MNAPTSVLETPLDRRALAARWVALCADPTFEDLAGKIELSEWGEILVSPVGKSHGFLAIRAADVVRAAFGGHAMVEVGILTDIGVRAPDVAWCSDQYRADHPEEAPLSSAPELCIEILSPSNSIVKLREKVAAYVRAGARESWILVADRKAMEIYGPSGRIDAPTFAVDVARLFE